MRKLIIAAAVSLSSLAGPAFAQYPAKPVRTIVQFAPGGAADAVLRIIAQPLGDALGQPVIVENRPGADGAIAGDAVRKSPPDGYTLFFGTVSALSAVPAMRKPPPYDPINDFTPIGRVGYFAFFLYVHPAVPAKSVSELIAYVRANPGKINYATGNGTSILASAQLAAYAKLDMMRVPYKGEAPATIDLLSGHVQMMFATPTPAGPHAKEGRLKVLATLLPQRSALMPDVPTMVEAGVPKLPVASWAGLFGPANLPPAIIAKVNRELNKVLDRADIRDRCAQAGVEVHGSTPEELAALNREQLEVWKAGVRDYGIAPD
jgi:tripartite-type tricarboxylate transporter receptor subunit TctC